MRIIVFADLIYLEKKQKLSDLKGYSSEWSLKRMSFRNEVEIHKTWIGGFPFSASKPGNVNETIKKVNETTP
jgi:hypothetical protein